MKRLLLLLLMIAAFAGCATTPDPARRVAVMDFESATGPDYKNLGVGVSEWMTNFMSNAPGIYVADRQDLNRFIGAHYKDKAPHLKYDRWQEVGEKMAIDYFIAGGITRLDGNFVINCRLFSVGYGQVVPGTAKEMSVKRVQDIFLATQSLSKFMLQQIRSRQLATARANGNIAPATAAPAPAPITQPGLQSGTQSTPQTLAPPPAPAQPPYIR